MVKSTLSHLQINVDPRNFPFYKELFSFLGWALWYEDPTLLGVGDERKVGLWFAGKMKETPNDYDSVGMNHLGLGVNTQAEVDQAAAYLNEHGIQALFNTPRHRPEFAMGLGQTYYQVMFESPDRILFEIVYLGPFST